MPSILILQGRDFSLKINRNGFLVIFKLLSWLDLGKKNQQLWSLYSKSENWEFESDLLGRNAFRFRVNCELIYQYCVQLLRWFHRTISFILNMGSAPPPLIFFSFFSLVLINLFKWCEFVSCIFPIVNKWQQREKKHLNYNSIIYF